MAKTKKSKAELEDKGIKSDGTIPDALRLGREAGIIIKFQQDLPTKKWAILFKGDEEPVITSDPVEAIMERLNNPVEIVPAEPLEIEPEPAEEQDDGEWYSAPEES